VTGVPEVEAASCGVEDLTALLDTRGCAIVRRCDVARAGQADRDLADGFVDTPLSEGLFYGSRTVRFGRLPARSPAVAALVLDRLVKGVAGTILGRGHGQMSLSFSQAIAVHPGSPVQAPHRDGEMWPVPQTGGEHLVSAMWALTPFTAENGATRVWVDSHAGGDGAAAACEVAAMEPGDVLLFLGSTLHAAGANRSGDVRRGVVIGYSAAWLVPSENPTLAYPPEVARTFPRELAELVGYRRIAPNLNNYDCRCPSELLRPGGMGTGAVDGLAPQQVAGLERFYGQLEGTPA
jgi:ectoine hydroxylase-related dioxygenase (phytanoyl-CoA dioxygenase family)